MLEGLVTITNQEHLKFLKLKSVSGLLGLPIPYTIRISDRRVGGTFLTIKRYVESRHKFNNKNLMIFETSDNGLIFKGYSLDMYNKIKCGDL